SRCALPYLLLSSSVPPPPPRSTPFPYTTLFRSYRGWPHPLATCEYPGTIHPEGHLLLRAFNHEPFPRWGYQGDGWTLMKQLHLIDRKSTRLNSSHVKISYAVFCLKKKKK